MKRRLSRFAFATLATFVATGGGLIAIVTSAQPAGATANTNYEVALIAGDVSNSDSVCNSNTSTVASAADGDGSPAGSGTTLCTPDGVASITSGPAQGTLIADSANDRLRFIPSVNGTYYGQSDLQAGDIYTIAGDGESPSSPYATTITAENGESATSVPLWMPKAVAVNASGDIAVDDFEAGTVQLVANQSCSSACEFGLTEITPGDIYNVGGGYNSSYPTGVTFDSSGDIVYVNEYDGENVVSLIAAHACASDCPYGLSSMAVGDTYTVAGSSADDGAPVAGEAATAPDLDNPTSVTVDTDGNLLVSSDEGIVDYQEGAQVSVVSDIDCPSASYTACPYGLGEMIAGDIYPIAGETLPSSSSAGLVAGVPALDAQIPAISDTAIDSEGNVLIAGESGSDLALLVLSEESCTAATSNTCPYGLASMTPGYVYQVSSVTTQSDAVGTPVTQLAFGAAQIAIDSTGDVILAGGTFDEVIDLTALAPTGTQPAPTGTYNSVPGIPTNVVAVEGGGSDSAGVSWVAPASNGATITSYTVTPYNVTIQEAGTPETVSLPAATAAVVSGLSSGDGYTFSVTATNSNGTGAASSPSVEVTVASSPTEQWNLVDPNGASSAGAINATIAYDAALGTFVMFGGGITTPYSSATYEWNGTDWAEVPTTTSPSARYDVVMAYDPDLDEVVLFGGINSEWQNDTWAFNGSTWTELNSDGGPAYSGDASMAYDGSAAGGQLVLVGGTAQDGSMVTYVLSEVDDAYEWVQATSATESVGWFGASMAYDTTADELVLVDGKSNYYGTTLNGNAWVWSGGSIGTATWTEVNVSGSTSVPTGRMGATLANDATDGDLFYYGGQNYSGVEDALKNLDDSWTLSLSGSTGTWVSVTPTPTTDDYPYASAFGSAASSGSEILRVAGEEYNGSYDTDYAQTWSYGDPPPAPTATSPVATQGIGTDPGTVGLSYTVAPDPGMSVTEVAVEDVDAGPPAQDFNSVGDAVEFTASQGIAHSYTVTPSYLPTATFEYNGDLSTSGEVTGTASGAAPFNSSWSPPYPFAPTGISGTLPGSGTTATVDWTVPASDGWPIAGFEVLPLKSGVAQTATFVSDGADGSLANPALGNSDTATISGLTSGGSYTYEVAAVSNYDSYDGAVGAYGVQADQQFFELGASSLDFSATGGGSTASLPAVTLTDEVGATESVQVSNIALGGTDPSDFTIASDTCTPTTYTISPGGQCAVQVEFTPPYGAALTSDTATLEVTDNATGSPQSVALSGTVAPASPSFSGTGAFGNVVENQTPSQTFTISNGSGAAAQLYVTNDAIVGDSSEFSISSDTCVDTPVAADSACTLDVTFAPGSSTSSFSSELQVTDNDSSSPHDIALSGTGVTSVASASPTSESFSELVGQTSAAQVVTLTNTTGQTSSFSVGPPTITGTNAADFAISSNTCHSGGSSITLANGSSCTVDVTFSPTTATSYSAELDFNDTSGNGPITVGLSGLGTLPSATASAASLSFAEAIGSTTSPQSVTLTNTTGQTSSFSVGPPTITGTNAADFAISSNTCNIAGGSTTLANGSSCTVSVTFSPTTATSYSAELNFNDTGDSEPHTVSLSGSVIPAGPSVSTTQLAFGNLGTGASAAQAVTIYNGAGSGTQVSPLALGSATISGSDAFSITHDGCSNTTVASGSSCTLDVVFAPGALGGATGTLSVPGVPSSDDVALSGTGISDAAVSTSSLSFGSIGVGSQSTTQTVSVSSGGTSAGALDISSVAVGGSDASEFSISSDGCTGAALADGATCSFAVGFDPTYAGDATGTVAISDNGAGSPQTVSLSGSASAVGSISGVIDDMTAGDVPLANVEVAICAQGSTAECLVTYSGATGAYSMSPLAPGDYRIQVTAPNGEAGSAVVDVTGPETQNFNLTQPRALTNGVTFETPGGAVSSGVPTVNWDTPFGFNVPFEILGSGTPNATNYEAFVVSLGSQSGTAGGGGFNLAGIALFSVHYGPSGVIDGMSNVITGQFACGPEGAPSICAGLGNSTGGSNLHAFGGSVSALFRSPRTYVPTSCNAPSSSSAVVVTPDTDGGVNISLPGIGTLALPQFATTEPASSGNPIPNSPVLLSTTPTDDAVTTQSGSGAYALVESTLTAATNPYADGPGASNDSLLRVESPHAVGASSGASVVAVATVDVASLNAEEHGQFYWNASTYSGPQTSPATGNYVAAAPQPASTVPCTTPPTTSPPAQTADFPVVDSGSFYVDPSGTIETTTGVPLDGATVILTRASSAHGKQVRVPNGSKIMSPANRKNPDKTAIDGAFAWDVTPGYYQIDATHPGCHAATGRELVEKSKILQVPPAVIDLTIKLSCPGLHLSSTVLKVSAKRIAKGGSLQLDATVGQLSGTRVTTVAPAHLFGTVTFHAGGTLLGSVALNEKSARAVLVLGALRRSASTITAKFSGNGVLASSTGSARVSVAKAVKAAKKK